jgi:hypothetical protein
VFDPTNVAAIRRETVNSGAGEHVAACFGHPHGDELVHIWP